VNATISDVERCAERAQTRRREPWQDPDRPSSSDMLDAAIDALVAMTLEAAHRPDPDEQITARIGRAAKRLRGQ